MEKLGDRNYALISRGVKQTGTYNPEECLYAFEEDLYMNEAEEIRAFLQWVHDNDKHFGSGNYEEVFSEFKVATGTKSSEDNQVDERVKVNSVVQMNEKSQEGWIGCLVQVSEVKKWGVQGWVQIPKSGSAYIRLKWGEFDYIGEAVLITKTQEG